MSRLDDALREALRREDPGPDFTRAVLARAAAARPRQSWWRTLTSGFRPPLMRWAAAGVLACALLAAGLEYRREQHLRAEGEAAKQQLVLALRIAGAKLHVAQEKVFERSD
ncbi:MAG: hypothetical protein ABSH05_08815 [Bryobacteraceae bacterium]|jgi:hypothetical protein